MVEKQIPVNRVCYACETNTSFDGEIEHWYANKPTKLYLCKKCWQNIFYNPIHNPINRKRTITFKQHDIVLKQNPRKGICLWCGFIGKTLIHHIQYHEDDPLKDTVEICMPCHIKEHWKLGSFKNKVMNQKRDPKTGRFLS